MIGKLLDFIKPYTILFELGLVFVIALGCFSYGKKIGTLEQAAVVSKLSLDLQTAQANSNVGARATETKMVTDASAIDSKFLKDSKDEKIKTDALVATARAGSLSIAAAPRVAKSRALPSADYTGAGLRIKTEARCNIAPAAAETLVGIVAEGDEAILQLNAVIDRYEAVRTTGCSSASASASASVATTDEQHSEVVTTTDSYSYSESVTEQADPTGVLKSELDSEQSANNAQNSTEARLDSTKNGTYVQSTAKL